MQYTVKLELAQSVRLLHLLRIVLTGLFASHTGVDSTKPFGLKSKFFQHDDKEYFSGREIKIEFTLPALAQDKRGPNSNSMFQNLRIIKLCQNFTFTCYIHLFMTSRFGLQAFTLCPLIHILIVFFFFDPVLKKTFIDAKSVKDVGNFEWHDQAVEIHTPNDSWSKVF